MKKWFKDWWFSILMFVFATAITLFVVFGYFFMGNDDSFICSLLIINCTSPILLLFIIGAVNQPKKDSISKPADVPYDKYIALERENKRLKIIITRLKHKCVTKNSGE